jgi:WD40 repeat protein
LTRNGQGIVRLIDPEAGREYARLEDPHQDRAGDLCFSHDGARLVASSSDTPAIHVWDLAAIRRELRAMGLDWDLPPYPRAGEGSGVPPLTSVEIEPLDAPGWRARRVPRENR